jgi:hypothetical protein
MLFFAIVASFVALILYAKHKRKKMLAAMTPEERKDFLAEEERVREVGRQAALKQEEIDDAPASLPARQAIDLSKAEGRSYARAWIPARDVERLERWASRNKYQALQVKTGTRRDVQMSFSGWKR